jgi:hypothetical protein
VLEISSKGGDPSRHLGSHAFSDWIKEILQNLMFRCGHTGAYHDTRWRENSILGLLVAGAGALRASPPLISFS